MFAASKAKQAADAKEENNEKKEEEEGKLPSVNSGDMDVEDVSLQTDDDGEDSENGKNEMDELLNKPLALMMHS